MTEGTISIDKDGRRKSGSGDVLCEIETDKATMEGSGRRGVLGKILIAGTEGSR